MPGVLPESSFLKFQSSLISKDFLLIDMGMGWFAWRESVELFEDQVHDPGLKNVQEIVVST